VSLLVPDFVKEGRAEGRAEGKAEGRAEGLREAVRRVATARLGPLPADVEAAVARMARAESLLAVLDALPAVESVDELRTRLAD
jgi:flagellar biosynthesis/type III secretory pathway protein FliH